MYSGPEMYPSATVTTCPLQDLQDIQGICQIITNLPQVLLSNEVVHNATRYPSKRLRIQRANRFRSK